MQVKKQQNQTWNSRLAQNWEGVQGCILSPCLFNLYAEYIKQSTNAGLEEAQDRNRTARENISNFRYADDTTLMAEIKEEL